MALGIKFKQPAPPSEPEPEPVVIRDEATMIVRLRIIQDPPPRLLVPPALPRPTKGAQLRQATVLDHLPDGTPYIRSYVEGHGTMRPGDTVYENARSSNTIFCSKKLGFQIALVACHHYCVAPCLDHLEAVQTIGWRSVDPKPQYVAKARRDEMEEDRTARKKKPDE